jgi:hypothetical protein
MRKTIAENILLWLGMGLLCPSIALLVAGCLLSSVCIPPGKPDREILSIASIALLSAFLLCFR